MRTLEASTSAKPSRRKVIRIFLAANFLFWMYFWFHFGLMTHPYQPHPPMHDDPGSFFVFWGRALDWRGEWLSPPVRLARWVQAPSFLVARPYVWVVNRNPRLWNETFLGVSPGGYLLLIVMALSFGQWYLVARVVAWSTKRARRPASPGPPSTQTGG